MFKTLRVLYASVAVLLSTALSCAASTLPEQVARDFKPVSGYVVQSSGNDYLIDLGSGQGVMAGDLFSVIGSGKTITHPVSGKILGNEEQVKGLLRLTRLKSGYSQSRPVGAVTDSIKRGDSIVRFQDMTAVVWDYTGQGEQIAKELQAALPHLQWHDYAAAQQSRPAVPVRPRTMTPTLYFILNSQGLEVRAPDFEQLHSYPLTNTAVSGNASQAQPAAVPVPPLLPVLSPAMGGAVQAGGEPLWNSATLKGTPVGVEAGDFDGDGRPEVAIAFADRVEIGRLNQDGYQPLGTIRLAAGSMAYALDAANLTSNGRPELYLSAMNSNGNPAGISIEFRDGRYRTTITKISWHLRTVSLPGEGKVLLAQEYNGLGREFNGPVFRVKRSGDHLSAGEKLPLPRRVNLYGFNAFSRQGRTLFACIDDDGYLAILTPSGEQLAGSPDTVGGTESYFDMHDETASGAEPRRVYLKSRVEITGQGTILVSANSGIGFLGSLKMYVKSELKLFHWNGKDLRETWHTAPDKSYLADFKLLPGAAGENSKLVTVVAFPSINPLTARTASVRMYDLGTP